MARLAMLAVSVAMPVVPIDEAARLVVGAAR